MATRIVTRNNLDSDYFEFDEDAKKIRPTGFAGHKEFGFEMDQIQARINAAQGLPAPSWHHEFGGGASMLDPRVTFSRSTPAWYFKNGVLRKAEMDEPVFENGVLRLEAQATNLAPNSMDMTEWIGTNSNRTVTPIENVDGDMTAVKSEAILAHPLVIAFTHPTTDSLTITQITRPRDGQTVIKGRLRNNTKEVYAPVGTYDVSSGAMTRACIAAAELGGGWYKVVYRFKAADVPGPPDAGDYYYWYLTAGTSQPGDVDYFAGIQVEVGESPTSMIYTGATPATRAADNFAFEGTAFQEAFNPNSGALVFKVGEGGAFNPIGNTNPYYSLALGTDHAISALTFSGLWLSSLSSARMVRGLYMKDPDIDQTQLMMTLNDIAYAGDTAAIAWSGDKVAAFTNGVKTGEWSDIRVPGGLAKATGLRINKALGINFPFISLYDHRPTDEQLEALTS